MDGSWMTVNVLKKQVVSLETWKPKLLPPQTHATAEKKKDVQDLLKLVKGTEEKKFMMTSWKPLQTVESKRMI